MDFEKKTWQFNDLITEDELNRMEDGIEEGITKAEQAQQTADSAATAAANAQSDIDAHKAEKVMDAEGAHGLTYEEGVWTPTIVGSTVPGSHTYEIQTGIYVKVNNLVHVQFRIDMSEKDPTMSGDVRIAGLPFVSKDYAAITAYCYRVNLPQGRTGISFVLFPGLNFIQLNNFGADASAPLRADEIRDDTVIIGSFTYLMR